VVTLAVLYAGFSLLFRSTYPRGLFDLAMGLDRWWYRVLVYVSLMTDAYPPFRLDQGGSEAVPATSPPAAGPDATHEAAPSTPRGQGSLATST